MVAYATAGAATSDVTKYGASAFLSKKGPGRSKTGESLLTSIIRGRGAQKAGFQSQMTGLP